MRKCKKCKAPVLPTWKFCNKCSNPPKKEKLCLDCQKNIRNTHGLTLRCKSCAILKGMKNSKEYYHSHKVYPHDK